MTTAYTSLLGLALPVTGELSGTWGDTVNDYITQYLDASVAGTQTISGSQTAVTLSKTTNASLSQAGSGATGSSQYNVINCTGNPASMLTVTVPAASKTYVVVNATSTNQDVKIVGAGPTTGVTLVAGERAIIAWNGSDFIKVATSTADGVTTLSFGSTGLTPSTATSGAVTVAGTLVAANGGTGQSSYTTGDLLYATGSTALSKLGIGTNGQILTSTGTAPQWSTLSGVAVTTFSAGTTGFTPSSATSGAVTLAGTLATTNGGTGLTSFTANGVVYASSTSALTTGSALTFDGTNLGVGNSSPTNAITVGTTSAGKNIAIYSSSNGNNGLLRMYDLGGTERLQLSANSTGEAVYYAPTGSVHAWYINTEQMRLTSTGLGIGTSSPAAKLDVSGFARTTSGAVFQGSNNLATGAGLEIGYNASSQGFVQAFNRTASTYQPVRIIGSQILFDLSNTVSMTLDSSGNLGLGVTPSAWNSAYTAFDIKRGSVFQNSASNWVGLANNAYNNGTNWIYKESTVPRIFRIQNDQFEWLTAPSGTAGNTISFTQAMTLDASGNLGVGTTSPASYGKLAVDGNISMVASTQTLFANKMQIVSSSNDMEFLGGSANILFKTGVSNTERARITAAGFTQPVAYADTVSALGNTGTAKTIDLQTANVFTATLTGNCTFTLSNPIATGSSSFTLILTNDGTAGRTVAWAGGSFVFPGGAASLSRTTTANAVDVWVFFTPNGGTTWYGNIAMKDMKA